MITGAGPAFAGHVAGYLAHGRALGLQYRQDHWLLHTLLRELPTLGCEDLTARSCQCWFEHRAGLHPNTRRKWMQMLRRFCLFRQRSDPGCFVPGLELICRAQPCVTPVILGNPQIARMIAVADTLEPSPNSPARSSAMRMAVALLYTTGMRLGELLRLVLGDIEEDGTVLRVRESKFHKTRLLPLSPSAQAELRNYLTRRARAGFDARPGAPLLCTRSRGRIRPYSASGMQQGLNAIFLEASVCAAGRPRPRVHDLRHSFAVQALARWYRQGADVQAQLPKLAMYMGHVSIESTAYYLRWTDEIGALASARFAQRFAATIGGQP